MEILSVITILAVVMVMAANRSITKERDFYKNRAIKLVARSKGNELTAQRMLEREFVTRK